MKLSVFLMAMVVAIVGAQRLPLVPLVGSGGEFAASLGGVPVGTFGRSRDYLGGTEAHASSLARAKVGLSGRDAQSAPRGFPVRPVPLLRGILPLIRRILDSYYLSPPYGQYYPQVPPYGQHYPQVPPYY